MLFSSITFLFIFLPLVLFVYYILLRKTEYRNYWLLIVSLCFYAWGEPVYVFLMLASIIGNYLLGLWMAKTQGQTQRQLILLVSVILNLGILFYFKYYDFVVKNLDTFLDIHLAQRNLPLPIGISFFTFQAMSYVIDLYRKTTPVQKNPCYLALYISFFPQLIAGPIVRYKTIEKQICSRTVSLDSFEAGVCR
ncbi:MAG: MBOAT family protein, partial [Anaerotignum sp.]|nr:MBOAT family protein [Anaerotignum sp.]